MAVSIGTNKHFPSYDNDILSADENRDTNNAFIRHDDAHLMNKYDSGSA